MSTAVITLPGVSYVDRAASQDQLYLDKDKISKYRKETTHSLEFSKGHPSDFWQPKAMPPYTTDRSAKDIRVINELRRQQQR